MINSHEFKVKRERVGWKDGLGVYKRVGALRVHIPAAQILITLEPGGMLGWGMNGRGRLSVYDLKRIYELVQAGYAEMKALDVADPL